MTTKAERKAAAQAEINERFKDVEPATRPSPWQYTLWMEYVQWEEGCDDDGWWEGTCPLQRDGRRRKHPARYNFSKDVMQCSEPDAGGGPSCHEGKNMLSLGNAALQRHG